MASGKKGGRTADINNKKSVFLCIQNNQSINRAAISKEVGISIPAVMTITEELLKNKIIQSIGYANTGAGKHPEMLSIRDDCYRYIGVDVGRVHLRAVLVGQDGVPVAKLTQPTRHGEDSEKTLEDICDLVNDLIIESEIDTDTLVGICVAMPGLIELETGKVIFSPNFGWKNYPLEDKLNQRLKPFKVIVRNANRAQGRYEIRPGTRHDRDSIVFCIGLGYGIGSAIINGGDMYLGASGTSGEIGHITVMPNGPLCTCGNTGCLEALASGRAIELKAKQIVQMNKNTMIPQLVNGDVDKIEAKTVFDAAAMGDITAMQIVDDTAKYVGVALAAAINIFDPDAIYLCGGLMKNNSEFLNKIKVYTRARQMKFAGRHVKIMQGSEDPYNVAKGATLLIQDEGAAFEKLSFLY